jgi:ketosteroid isomerase-like protein
MRTALSAACLTFLTACTAAAQVAARPAASVQAAPSSSARAAATAARSALLRADATLSASNDSLGAEGFAGGLADDAVYLYPGAPVMQGRGTVRAFLAAQPATAPRVLRWQPLHAQLSADGAAGYTFGVTMVSMPARNGGGQVVRFGQYLTFWRAAGDGHWRVAASMQTWPGGPSHPASPDGWSAGFAPAPPRGAARTGVEAADRDFAAFAGPNGPARAFWRWAAPDALTFGDAGALLRGPDAISTAFGPEDEHSQKWEWGPVFSGAAEAGDLGFTVGESIITVTGEGGRAQAFHGKYLTIWQRQADGTWKYVMDGGNPRPAPAPMTASAPAPAPVASN